MKRTLFALAAAAVMASTAPAHAYDMMGGTLDVDFQTGWRQDRFDFSTSDEDFSSQRIWKNLRTYDNSGRADFVYCNVLLSVYGNYGKIYNGHSVQKAYDNGVLINEIKAESDRGEVFDYGVALGYNLPWCFGCQQFVFTPLVGWSNSQQHLQQKYGEDLVAPGAGPLGQMSSNYQTRWNGPWVGYNVQYELPWNLTLHQMFEWHWANFRAHGKDTERALTSPFAVRSKYTQKDHGSGYLVGAGAEYAINRCWILGVNGYYNAMTCHNGTQKTNQTVPVVAETSSTLSSVHWRGWVVRGEIGYKW